MDGWRCRTLYDGPLRRVLRSRCPGRTRSPPRCDAGRPCVDGSRCVDGRCVPATTGARRACCRPTARPVAAGSAAAWRRARDDTWARAGASRARASCSRRRSVVARARPPLARATACDWTRPLAPVGFDAPFSVRATLARDIAGGRIDWRQLAGPALHDAAAQADGKTFSARMPSITDATGAPPPWGIVPVSPRTRGDVAIEATWTRRRRPSLCAPRRASRRRVVRAACPTRPCGVRIHLGGDGWHVLARPAGSTAALDAATGAASLLPDVAGDWRLADGDGRTLALRTARYDETPLDCGRSGCHADITAAAARSPMTTVHGARARAHARWRPRVRPGLPRLRDRLPRHRRAGRRRRRLQPRRRRAGRRRAISRRSLARAAAGAAPAGRCRLPRLPRTSRDPRGRRALEPCCATTSAPSATTRPRATGTSSLWRGSRMAHADHDARARNDRACARCHTTWGFLETIDRSPGERDRRADRSPPPHAGPVGITCAACHAVHDPARAARRATCCVRHPRRPACGRRPGRGCRRDRGQQRRLPPLPHARRRRARAARHRGGADGRSAAAWTPRRGRAADRRARPRGRRRRLRRLPPRRPRPASSAAPATGSQAAPARVRALPPEPAAGVGPAATQARRLWQLWRGRRGAPAAATTPTARASNRRRRRAGARSGTCCWSSRIRPPRRTTPATRGRCWTPPNPC